MNNNKPTQEEYNSNPAHYDFEDVKSGKIKLDPIDDDEELFDGSMEIYSDVLDKDFDDVNFDGTIDSDEDEDAADMFGY